MSFLFDVVRRGPLEILAVQDVVAVFDTSDPTAANSITPVSLTPAPGICPTPTVVDRSAGSRYETGYVYAVAVSPDCCFVAAATQDPAIRLFDLVTGTCLARLWVGHVGRVLCLNFSSDSSLLLSGGGGAGGQEKSVRTWSMTHKVQFAQPAFHENEVYAVTWIETGDEQRRGEGGANHHHHHHRHRHQNEENPILRFASGGADFTTRIWSINWLEEDADVKSKPKPVQIAIFHHRGIVRALAVTQVPVVAATAAAAKPPAAAGAAENDGAIATLDPKTTATQTQTQLVLIAGSDDTTVRFFYDESPSYGASPPPATAKSPSSAAATVANKNNEEDGNRDGGGAAAVDLDDDEKQAVEAASFSWKERGAAAKVDGCINGLSVVHEPSSGPLSPTLFASCLAENTLVRIDVKTRQVIRTVVSAVDFIAWSLSTNRDGSVVACGAPDGLIRIFDRRGLKLAAPLKGHKGGVVSMALAPDDRTLVSAGGSDGSLRMWRLCVGRNVFSQRLHAPIATLDVSEDGCSLVVTEVTGSKRAFQLPLPALLDASVVVSCPSCDAQKEIAVSLERELNVAISEKREVEAVALALQKQKLVVDEQLQRVEAELARVRQDVAKVEASKKSLEAEVKDLRAKEARCAQRETEAATAAATEADSKKKKKEQMSPQKVLEMSPEQLLELNPEANATGVKNEKSGASVSAQNSGVLDAAAAAAAAAANAGDDRSSAASSGARQQQQQQQQMPTDKRSTAPSSVTRTPEASQVVDARKDGSVSSLARAAGDDDDDGRKSSKSSSAAGFGDGASTERRNAADEEKQKQRQHQKDLRDSERASQQSHQSKKSYNNNDNDHDDTRSRTSLHEDPQQRRDGTDVAKQNSSASHDSSSVVPRKKTEDNPEDF